MKPMDSPPAMVASAILEHRNDTAALTHLQETGN
ncbi:IS1294 transposase [Erwinia tracheiphila PSU-1]|nr:IS1294 transposase [Erwinia tracheiphila PSU-1]